MLYETTVVIMCMILGIEYYILYEQRKRIKKLEENAKKTT